MGWGKRWRAATEDLRIRCDINFGARGVLMTIRQCNERLQIPMTATEARTVAGGLLGAAQRTDPAGHHAALVGIAADVGLTLQQFIPDGHGEER